MIKYKTTQNIVSIRSAHADSSNHYKLSNKLAYLFLVYCAIFLRRIDKDTWTIVSDVVRHACQFLRQSNLDDVSKTLYPNAANIEETVLDREPVKIKFKHISKALFDKNILYTKNK